MNTIEIDFLNKKYLVILSKIPTFPYDICKIEFDEIKLLNVMDSPVYITEKSNGYIFPPIINVTQMEMLMSFICGIER